MFSLLDFGLIPFYLPFESFQFGKKKKSSYKTEAKETMVAKTISTTKKSNILHKGSRKDASIKKLLELWFIYFFMQKCSHKSCPSGKKR